MNKLFYFVSLFILSFFVIYPVNLSKQENILGINTKMNYHDYFVDLSKEGILLFVFDEYENKISQGYLSSQSLSHDIALELGKKYIFTVLSLHDFSIENLQFILPSSVVIKFIHNQVFDINTDYKSYYFEVFHDESVLTKNYNKYYYSKNCLIKITL